MVDAHVITHLKDGLVLGLDFGSNEKTAEYVHSSKHVRFRAQASDRFSPAAGKVIRFRLVDDCWLQSGTVRFAATLFNKRRHRSKPRCTSRMHVSVYEIVFGRTGLRDD